MKNRKLGDAMHFFEEMKRRGMQPDVRRQQQLVCFGVLVLLLSLLLELALGDAMHFFEEMKR